MIQIMICIIHRNNKKIKNKTKKTHNKEMQVANNKLHNTCTYIGKTLTSILGR